MITVIHGLVQSGKKSHPTHPFPAEVEQGDAPPSCFSSHRINKYLFQGLFSGRGLHVFVGVFVDNFVVLKRL